MHSLKRYFVVPYLLACMLSSAHVLWVLVAQQPADPAWYGAALALWPMLGFMIYLGVFSRARTSALMPWQLGAVALAAVISLLGERPALAMIYVWLLGVVGVVAYVFWYSRLGRDPNRVLVRGEKLPAFELEDMEGNAISSSKFLGRKLLLLFYRGNWCPLCVAQIKEIAGQYRELEQLGVTVVMVSPQPHKKTRELAQKFDAPMQFCVDRNARAAKTLDIFHRNGIAAGVGGYGADTVLPTVIMTDEEGRILYCDLTDNYRVRPEPAEFLAVLNGGAANA
ncbi:peroxiredoxin family protein [Litorivivens sp.]|uniref:peroxiredoxin family protein n=3 Tax=Litorivivens sp. TaxID=2020868 RepID=UPI00356A2F17